MMVHPAIAIPVAGLSAYILHSLIKSTLQYLSLRKFAKEHNCLPAPIFPHKYPFGIDFVIQLQHDVRTGYILTRNSDNFDRLGEDVHTFVNNYLGTSDIMTRDPENIKAILAKQFDQFQLPDFRQKGFEPFLGDGIFTMNGLAWEHSRALLRPQFNKVQISGDLHAQEFHVKRLMGRFLEIGQDGKQMFDAQPWFFRFTLDTATEFLFGESVGSLLEGNEEEVKNFTWAFNTGLYILAQRLRIGKYYAWTRGSEFDEACNVARNYVGRFVDRALRWHAEGGSVEKAKQQGRYVFLEALVEETQDRKMLTDQILNILLAGRDTTAGLLSCVVWLLARNKDVFQKLREEVLREVGPTATPTWEGIKEMKYLKWVLNETLRLYPLVPLNTRQAKVRTTIPRGGGPDGRHPIVIEKGQKVAYSVFAMQRRKELYGPDATQFNPDRWANLRVGWEYLPFNGGPRICLGQQFALTEASFVVIKFCQQFGDVVGYDRVIPVGCEKKGMKIDAETPGMWKEAESSDNRETRGYFKEAVNLTLSSKDGVWVKMIPAKFGLSCQE